MTEDSLTMLEVQYRLAVFEPGRLDTETFGLVGGALGYTEEQIKTDCTSSTLLCMAEQSGNMGYRVMGLAGLAADDGQMNSSGRAELRQIARAELGTLYERCGDYSLRRDAGLALGFGPVRIFFHELFRYYVK